MSGAAATVRADRAAPTDDAAPAALTVHRTVDAVERIATEWSGLRASLRCETLSNDPGRFAATVRAMSAEPMVIEARREGRLCGILAGRLATRRLGVRIGYVRLPSPRLRCLDVVYGGVMAAASEDVRLLVAEVRSLLRRGTVDHLFVNMLAEDHPARGLLGRRSTGESSTHWVLEMPGASFESAMSRHSSKHMGKIRRYERRLAEAVGGELEVRVVTDPEGVQGLVEAAESIASTTYQAELGFGVRDTPLWRGLLRASAERGSLRAYLLMGGGRPIAYQNGCVYGHRFCCDGKGYLAEFGEHRPGTVLLMRMLRDLCGIGVEEVDFGFGDAEYKRIYATRHFEERPVRMYGGSLRARLAAAEAAVAGAADRSLRGIADRTGLSARIRRVWRRRLASAQGADVAA